MPSGYLEGGSVTIRGSNVDWCQTELVLEKHGTSTLDEIPDGPEVMIKDRRGRK